MVSESVNMLDRKVYEGNDGLKLDVQKAQFEVFSLSSSPVCCGKGVRQADLLSPLLFCTAEEVLYGGILDLHFKGLLKPISAPRICFLPTHTMIERKAIIDGSQGGVSNSSLEYSSSQFPGLLMSDHICAPKREGGLGLKMLNSLNKSCLMKFVWEVPKSKYICSDYFQCRFIDTLEINCKHLKIWEAWIVKSSSRVSLEAWT
ncbi:hypothetical protein WN944_019140 [Citrus x changshan-huyou]|uniref:Uncharacterized protein n=1 Tax=Citrus x changshan-huyou TaxID=2935761 RepID=A0AAP0LVM9_9ROSI